MKINSHLRSNAVPERITTTKASAAAYQQNNAPSSAAVDFSAAARQLNQLQSTQNDIDLERVQQLRQAIADGTLEMDTSRIADRIIASARDLLG